MHQKGIYYNNITAGFFQVPLRAELRVRGVEISPKKFENPPSTSHVSESR